VLDQPAVGGITFQRDETRMKKKKVKSGTKEESGPVWVLQPESGHGGGEGRPRPVNQYVESRDNRQCASVRERGV